MILVDPPGEMSVVQEICMEGVLQRLHEAKQTNKAYDKKKTITCKLFVGVTSEFFLSTVQCYLF